MKVVMLCVAGLFGIAIVGLIALKWHDPSLDATFMSVLVAMVMGMASFLALHFKQQDTDEKMSKKMEDVATNAVNVAESLREENAMALVEQTKKITEFVDDKAMAITSDIADVKKTADGLSDKRVHEAEVASFARGAKSETDKATPSE